jgi:thiol-disulfide isomerase/thioredoxin
MKFKNLLFLSLKFYHRNTGGMKSHILLIFSSLLLGCSLNTTNIDSSKIFLDYTIDSLEDLQKIEQLKGKELYVDIWGSYCKPCFKSFEATKELRVSNKKEKIVFICHDRGDDLSIKKLIDKYDLNGYHLKISSEGITKLLMDEILIFGALEAGLPLNYFISEEKIEKAPPLEDYLLANKGIVHQVLIK